MMKFYVAHWCFPMDLNEYILKYVFICYMTAYISGNHTCMLFMLQIGVVSLYCMSSYGG
jgi:hypothetical protein